jgi:short-subunit dehydrogenase
MRDVAEKTILVTGATDGLGRRVARELAAGGANVLLHGRSQERLEATLEEVRTQTGSERLRYYLADFSSLGEVRELARRILSDEERMDVLVNNAGIIVRERRRLRAYLRRQLPLSLLAHTPAHADPSRLGPCPDRQRSICWPESHRLR